MNSSPQRTEPHVDVLMAVHDGAEWLADVLGSLVAQTGATGPQEMGKVMAVLKPKLAGRADMTAVSALVKAALST